MRLRRESAPVRNGTHHAQGCEDPLQGRELEDAAAHRIFDCSLEAALRSQENEKCGGTSHDVALLDSLVAIVSIIRVLLLALAIARVHENPSRADRREPEETSCDKSHDE
jgi:hypothetical protein